MQCETRVCLSYTSAYWSPTNARVGVFAGPTELLSCESTSNVVNMSHAPSWMPQQWTCANATAELFAYCASPPSHSSSAIDDGVVCRPAVEALWDSWSACACCTCILITRLQLRFVCTNVLHEALQYRRSCMSRQDLAYRY